MVRAAKTSRRQCCSTARRSRQRHGPFGNGITEVEGVFHDNFALTREDKDHDEARFVTLGADGIGRVLVVAFAYRGEDEIRVISARRAQPHERRLYEE